MKISGSMLMLVLLLSGCMSNPAREDVGKEDLVTLRQHAASTYQEREYTKALPLYEMLVAQVPDDGLLWFRLGNLRTRLKQPDQAIEAYRRAVQLNPRLDKAWHNLSILYLRQATNSLTQMLQYTDPKGPLYPKALKLSEGVVQLLESERAAPSSR